MSEFAVVVRRDAAVYVGEPEHLIDRAEDVLSRAERMVEPYKTPGNVGGKEVLLEMPPCRVVFARCGALERENRLLFVAHGEDRTSQWPPQAGAGAEFLHQPFDDVPLFFAGVLRFVDQYVIQTEIELVVHPVRVARGEQAMGPVDQIVIVEETAALLFVAI